MTTRATIRRAGKGDAAALCAAEQATALTPGLLVSQPHELQVDAFEQKIEFLKQEGVYLVAESEEFSLDTHCWSRWRSLRRLTSLVSP